MAEFPKGGSNTWDAGNAGILLTEDFFGQPPTPTGNVSVWSGAAWMPGALKVWSGSAYLTGTPTVY
jgi:hypothetical protein